MYPLRVYGSCGPQVDLAIGLTILECCNRALSEPDGRVQDMLGETKQGACVLAGMITESLWRELPWLGSVGEPFKRKFGRHREPAGSSW